MENRLGHQLSPLYFIADDSFGELPNLVEKALRGGVRMIQLRCKKIPTKKQEQLAQQLKNRTADYLAALIINDDPWLCHRIGASGVHLGKEDTSPTTARHILGRDAIIGMTLHNHSEAAGLNYEEANYVSLGPVFPTKLKSNLKPLGISGLAKLISVVRKHSSVPIFCIGGIHLDNIEQLKSLAIDGVAIGSAIGTAKDPTSICRHINRMMNEFSV